MIGTFFPLKKLRRNGRYFLFGAILLVGAAAVYHEMVAAKAWSGGTSKFAVASADDVTTGPAQALNFCNSYASLALRRLDNL